MSGTDSETKTITFTLDELEAIGEALNDHILSGFADGNNHPIVTALMKVDPHTPKQFDED